MRSFALFQSERSGRRDFLMISIENLSVRYPDGTLAINGLSLEIKDGESCALLGENGAGKSSLFKAILGLLPIESGKIAIGGVELTPKNLREIRKMAGMVFQNSDDQLFSATVEDDVSFGLRNCGVPESETREKCASAMEKFLVSHLKGRSPQRLSDGEKKRVAICATVITEPKALLLDEPTAQLDPRARREISELIGNLNLTRLIATHDLDFAKKYCPTCAILRNGKLRARGATSELLADGALMLECGLA